MSSIDARSRQPRSPPTVRFSQSLAQLRRNGWITTAQEGVGLRVGLGPRVCEIAAQWGIDLPSHAIETAMA